MANSLQPLPSSRHIASRTLCLIFLVLSAFTIEPHSSAAEYESRIWTDRTGKHEIKAKFIDVEEGQVRLERPNGDISRIPLDKLSDADQDYVKGGAKHAQPQQPVAPIPHGLQIGDRVEADHFGKWEPAVVTEIDYKWEDIEVRIEGDNNMQWTKDLDELRYPETLQRPVLVKPASPASSLKTIRPNYDDMEQLLADGKPASKIPADPQVSSASEWKARAVRLSGKSDFFESPVDFAIAGTSSPLALILHENHHNESFPRVELVDLKSRKVISTGPGLPGTDMLSMSPTGTAAASFQSEIHGPDSTGRVDFWKIAERKVSHWVSFVPYEMNSWPKLDPEWFSWLDEERLFTSNSEGKLILWQVDGAKALYELMIDSSAQPILSQGRKYLVVPTTTGIQFFNATSGELQSIVGSGNFLHAALAFSPSGRQLAVASNDFIDVIDVTTGETTRSFPCKDVGSNQPFSWIDEEYLYAGDGLIVNVPLRIIAWKYDIQSKLVKPYAGTHWALLENNTNDSQVLTPLVMPPPEALDSVKQLDEEELLVVNPGDAISIDVQIHDDNFLAQDVKLSLEEALAAAGMKLAEDSPLKLVARTKTGETQKIRYRNFHDHFGEGELIEVINRIYEMELLLNGVVVWKRESVHSAPFHLQLQEGETTRDAISRVMKPSGANFRGRLPSYVVRPEYLEPLGTSRLSL